MIRIITLIALLVSSIAAAHGAEPKRLLLLVQGPDGHPAGTHEYVAGMEILAKELQNVAGLEAITVNVDEPWSDGPKQLADADGALLYLAEGAKWISADPRRQEAFQKLAERGGGLSCLHWAMGAKSAEPIDAFLALFGGCHGGPDRKYQVVQTTLAPAADNFCAGVPPFTVRDEFYYALKFTKQPGLKPLWYAKIDGAEQTVAWTWERPDGGRSFGFSGGHFHENWQRDQYRQLVRISVLWTLDLE